MCARAVASGRVPELTHCPLSPQAHPRTHGAKGPVRFGYLSLSGADTRYHGGVMHGVAKFDLLAEQEVGRIDFGARIFGGETLFVPAASDGSGDEDAGFLLNILRDDATGAASLVIFDARTMAAAPLATVRLVGHVPFGFHAGFLARADVERLLDRHADRR